MKRFQIVIPNKIRERMKIRQGDQVKVEYVDGKIVIAPLRGSSEKLVRDTFGALHGVKPNSLRKALKEPEAGLAEAN